MKKSEMSKFLDNNLDQVEALLYIIATPRSRDWEGCLAAIDHYHPLSLKEKTRAKRAISHEAISTGYEIHDEMNIKTVSLQNLLSCSKTKGQLAGLLAKGLLEEYKKKDL